MPQELLYVNSFLLFPFPTPPRVALGAFLHQDLTPNHSQHGKAPRHLVKHTRDKRFLRSHHYRLRRICPYTLVAHILRPATLAIIKDQLVIPYITALHTPISCIPSPLPRQTTRITHIIWAQVPAIQRNRKIILLKQDVMEARCLCQAHLHPKALDILITRIPGDIRTQTGRSFHPSKRAVHPVCNLICPAFVRYPKSPVLILDYSSRKP